MEGARIQILSLKVQRQRVTLIGDIHIEICNQHISALNILRLGTKQQVVGERIHREVEFRAVGKVQTLGDGVQQRVNLLDGHLQRRIAALLILGKVGIALHLKVWQILVGRHLQEAHQIGIGCRAGKCSIGKLRVKAQLAALLGAMGNQSYVLRAQSILAVAVETIIDIHRATHCIGRASHSIKVGIQGKMRQGVSLVDIHRKEVGIIHLEFKVVERSVAIHISLTRKVKLQRSAVT